MILLSKEPAQVLLLYGDTLENSTWIGKKFHYLEVLYTKNPAWPDVIALAPKILESPVTEFRQAWAIIAKDKKTT